jgi:hypothetical protein
MPCLHSSCWPSGSPAAQHARNTMNTPWLTRGGQSGHDTESRANSMQGSHLWRFQRSLELQGHHLVSGYLRTLAIGSTTHVPLAAVRLLLITSSTSIKHRNNFENWVARLTISIAHCGFRGKLTRCSRCFSGRPTSVQPSSEVIPSGVLFTLQRHPSDVGLRRKRRPVYMWLSSTVRALFEHSSISVDGDRLFTCVPVTAEGHRRDLTLARALIIVWP